MQHVLNAVHLQLEVARRRMVFQARLEYGVWAQWDQPPLVEVIQAVFVERVFVGAVRTRAGRQCSLAAVLRWRSHSQECKALHLRPVEPVPSQGSQPLHKALRYELKYQSPVFHVTAAAEG